MNTNKNNQMHWILSDENVLLDIFAILLTLFEFIRVIRGLTHYLGLCPHFALLPANSPINSHHLYEI